MVNKIKEPQRLNIKHMTALTVKKSGYTSEEVRDVLEVFYDTMREQLYLGNSILFERLFKVEIIKPEPKRMRDLKTGKIVMSAAHPRPKLTPSRGLLDYIRAQKGTILKVKRGTASRRLQHHSNTTQKEYYEPKEKQCQEEFPLPR
jgi:nucleoid DNA-binding protein